ncbi:MAG: chemotaxis protein CheX [Candidatus Firestonebacteria bacterium]|nr:chemotaxis protein CheX [Candidatus Firestonebacteria bacterium]
MPPAGMADWIQALTDSAGEIAAMSLGFEECRVTGQACEDLLASPTDPAWVGAFISVQCREDALHLGLVADASGCETLAKALLGMAPSEILPEEDVSDSLRELVNILAGGVKRRLAAQENTLQLGLPQVVQGPLEVADLTEAARIPMTLGPIPVQLQIIRSRALPRP